MAGDDPIMAVSRVFASLADDGGAAADSLEALNNILKNSLNRTLIRFNRTMADTVKSVAAFNLGLKSASKRMSANVTQKQAARMGAASQASQAIHRTQAYYTQQQTNKALKQPQVDQIFSELADIINNPVLNSLQQFADKINSVVDVLSKLIIVYGSYKTAQAAFKGIGDAAEDSLDEVRQMLIEKNAMIGGKDPNKTGRENRIESAQLTQSNITRESLESVRRDLEKLFNEKDTAAFVSNQLQDELELLSGAASIFTDNSNAMARAAAAFDRYTRLETEYKGLEDIESWLVNNQDRLMSEAGKEAGNYRLSDAVETITTQFTKVRSSIVKYIAATDAATLAVGAGFAAAIAYVTYKMYDFGKNAIPRLYNYLLKPLQTVYEFVNGPLNQAFSKVTSFVSVLNPAYGEQASRALDDLSAVVGRILLPVFNAMLGSLKVFTSFLSINADRLKGTMEALSNVIANVGTIVIGNFFQLLQDAQPILIQLTDAFLRAIPVINNSLMKLFKEIQKHIPTFIQAIDAIGMMLEMYLKQKLQEFANEAALASKAAQNQARAMQLFGEEAISLSMAFNNLGYYLADFALQLEAVIIELMGWVNWLSGKPQAGGIVGAVEFAGGEDERELNAGEKAGKAVRQWIAGLFGAEDVPWAKKPKEKPEMGAGEFNNIAGGGFGEDAAQGLQEGFAGKGAAFQEIGQLGKNLAAASFGMGAGTVEDRQLNVQQQILGGVNQMLQNQNQFNGAAPVQGVR